MNYKNTQQLNKIGKAMNERNEKFNKEIENIKKKKQQQKSYSWKLTELKSVEIFKRRISDPEE